MSEQLQLFFDRALKSEKEKKDINAQIKDALRNSQEFAKLMDEDRILKAKINACKQGILSDFIHELDQLDELKNEIDNDKMLMSDVAVSKLMKGESIGTIKDSKGNEYEPDIVVKFKKIK